MFKCAQLLSLAIALAQIGCGAVQTRATDRFVLTDKPLTAATVTVVDIRETSAYALVDSTRGYRVPEVNLEPRPLAFVTSEVSKLLASDPKYKDLATLLRSRTISLSKFDVHVRAADITVRSSQPPGFQAIDYGVKSMATAMGLNSELVVDLEVAVDAQHFGKQATWTAQWTPAEHATVFPAYYVVLTVLDQMKESLRAR